MIGEATTISISLLIAIAAILVNIVININTQRRNEDEKRVELEKNFTRLNVKIDMFSQHNTELVKDMNKQYERAEELSKVVIANSERIKTLFNKLEDHEERITRLEEKR